jgi:hypothetical protein
MEVLDELKVLTKGETQKLIGRSGRTWDRLEARGDESRPRGHSSLPGAVDAQLHVERTNNLIAIEVELMRDGPEGGRVTLEAQEVVVGQDAKSGKPLTSLVLIATDKPVETGKGKTGRPDRTKPIFDKAFDVAIHRDGESFTPHGGAAVYAVDVERVRGFFNKYFLNGGGGEAKGADRRRMAFKRALEKQQDEGHILGERDEIHNREMIWRPTKAALRE